MELLHIFSAIIFLAGIFAFLNERYLKLPSAISLLILGLGLSLLIQGIGSFSPGFYQSIEQLLERLDFSAILLEFMLSFLLFAGALHTDLNKLAKQKWPILTFATIGIVISTAVVGTFFYYLVQLFGYSVPFISCLVFGSLISPTDPIAVLGILKKAGVPKSVEIKITGESLFNDGVGVVLFLVLFDIARKGTANFELSQVSELILVEIGGGIFLGLALGYLGYRLLKSIDHYQTEVLITLAIVMGGYSFATILHMSGPLAVVVAGLMIGNKATDKTMSATTYDYINKFWEIVDEILNAVLFVFIGLELLIIPFHFNYIVIGLISAIAIVGIRFGALALPSYALGFNKTFLPNSLKIMTWGGLRGGISVALALTLHGAMQKELIVAVTYVVVLFSIVVQGLTVGPLVKRLSTDKM
jgi:monovalent cation:H+ antiporter, CPA1 family